MKSTTPSDIAKKTYFRAGVFGDVAAAATAVHGLLEAGFDKDQISVICSEDTKRGYFEDFNEKPAGERTPQATAAGGAIGAVLGTLTAVGLVTTGGAILFVTAAFGAMFGGVAGGLVGALTTRGVEREVADYYDQAVQDGKILVAVEVAEEGPVDTARAAAILNDSRAEALPLREG